MPRVADFSLMEAFIFRKSCLFEYFEVSLRCVDVRVFLNFVFTYKDTKKMPHLQLLNVN